MLYEEVWAEPVQRVARRYGVSGVALAKTCRRLAVPVPPRGYWARLRAGSAPSKPALPPLQRGMRSQIVVEAVAPSPAKDQQPKPDIPQIKVPAALRWPHPLVARAAEHLKSGRGYHDIHYCRFSRCLDTSASRQNLQRALRIADALLKAMEKAGMSVRITGEAKDYWGRPDRNNSFLTQVCTDGEWVSFAIQERVETEETRRVERARGRPRTRP